MPDPRMLREETSDERMLNEKELAQQLDWVGAVKVRDKLKAHVAALTEQLAALNEDRIQAKAQLRDAQADHAEALRQLAAQKQHELTPERAVDAFKTIGDYMMAVSAELGGEKQAREKAEAACEKEDPRIQAFRDLQGALRAALKETQAERDVLQTQLAAWQNAFGTTQLTHAVADRDALAEMLREWDEAFLALKSCPDVVAVPLSVVHVRGRGVLAALTAKETR